MTLSGDQSVTIRIDDLNGPEIAALLTEHLECMAQVSPPESNAAISGPLRSSILIVTD